MPALSDILLQVAVAAVPLGVAGFAYRASTLVNRRQGELDRSKVDVEAFARAQSIYETGMTQLERQLARSQAQIAALEEAVVLLRAQLIESGISPDPRTAIHILNGRKDKTS